MNRVSSDHSFVNFSPVSYKDRFGVEIDTSSAKCHTAETNRTIVRTNIDDKVISRSVPIPGFYIRK